MSELNLNKTNAFSFAVTYNTATPAMAAAAAAAAPAKNSRRSAARAVVLCVLVDPGATKAATVLYFSKRIEVIFVSIFRHTGNYRPKQVTTRERYVS